MGEYAKLGSERVKIGTCEDMYYLRADQRFKVMAEPGNVRPGSDEDCKVLRFRFPWPDEDTEEPGAFEGAFNRGLGVHVQFSQPINAEHGMIQFSARVGLLCSLPCPNGPDALQHLKIHRNGYAGDVVLTQQGFREGELRAICRCGVCGYAYNLPLWAAEELAVAIRSEGDRKGWNGQEYGWHHGQGGHDFYHAVADRVLAGYKREAVTP